MMANCLDWSLETALLRRQLLNLPKPKLIRACKYKNVSCIGTKKDMVERILNKKQKQDKKKKKRKKLRVKNKIKPQSKNVANCNSDTDLTPKIQLSEHDKLSEFKKDEDQDTDNMHFVIELECGHNDNDNSDINKEVEKLQISSNENEKYDETTSKIEKQEDHITIMINIKDDDTEKEKEFICAKCYKQIKICEAFLWSNCNHKYCNLCASNIINECLSLFNIVPKCQYLDCNHRLNIQTADKIKYLLLPRYQITKNILYYQNIENLIYGFIRNCNVSNPNIPTDLILLLFDFYILVYFEKIPCYHCKSIGYQLLDCLVCNKLGYTINCENCNFSGFCQKRVKCNHCDGNGNGYCIATTACNACHGRGGYHVNTISNHKRSNLHTPIYVGEWRKCGCSGGYRKQYTDCIACNGKGMVDKTVNCNVCKLTIWPSCNECNGAGTNRCLCNKCKGTKYLAALDFKKVCNKQMKCNRCNHYFTYNFIVLWSSCNHMYCSKCIIPYICGEIENDKVPICMIKNCPNQLTVNGMRSLNMENKYKLYQLQLVEKLKFLIHDQRNKNRLYPFTKHLTLSQTQQLQVNDIIDHRDEYGKFCVSTIIEKNDTNLKIHYNGYSDKYNVWSDCEKETYLFAEPYSISKRISNNDRFEHLKVGSYINISTPLTTGWKCGKIIRFDQDSSQIRVAYKHHHKIYIYWMHLDDTMEISIDPKPYTMEYAGFRIKLNHFVERYFMVFLVIVILAGTGLIAYSSSMIFEKAENMKINGRPSNEGKCVIIDRYFVDDSFIDQYQYKIYNNTMCNNLNDDAIYTFSENHGKLEPFKYQMDDVIACYSNKDCNDVWIDKDMYYDDATSGVEWMIFGAIIVAIIAICCCCCGGCYVIWLATERRNESMDKNEHYDKQWNDIMTNENQRIEYFMNHYLTKYGLINFHDPAINKIVSNYHGH